MYSSENGAAAEWQNLLARYEKWRRVYALAGKAPRDDPVWEAGRLHLRSGFPYPGWAGFILQPNDVGWAVLRVTSERRNEPLESLCGVFSSVDEAGKYIVLKVGEYLRIDLRLDPIEWAWEDSGLDQRVRQLSIEQYVSRFELKDDPSRYFVLQVGGVQPVNKLLTLSYDELDALLLEGMPESVLSGL
ncbi:hypothetical protein [Mycolicibacterium rhodesiae]|uniref:hypothetical protein n=1 Tax=Mycolicibacterium rhodesiae TaxID=36814 RepID=UPI00105527ED|nr:hypothetical protein [Mycolicibacterium rhodesiae]MCV7347337.1 hypothetical protein [Mycolicibacterium rhodesiae]